MATHHYTLQPHRVTLKFFNSSLNFSNPKDGFTHFKVAMTLFILNFLYGKFGLPLNCYYLMDLLSKTRYDPLVLNNSGVPALPHLFLATQELPEGQTVGVTPALQS